MCHPTSRMTAEVNLSTRENGKAIIQWHSQHSVVDGPSTNQNIRATAELDFFPTMADFYQWLNNTYGPPPDADLPYAPNSPPTLLDIDDDGNMYFDYADMPPQAETTENASIDPTLMNIDPAFVEFDPMFMETMNPMPHPVSNDSVVTVPDHLAGTSRRLLIYLAKVLDIPPDVEDYDNTNTKPVDNGPVFTAEELEILEPIPEASPDPSLPDTIDDIPVVYGPQTEEIEELIDCR
jgi:hypothetical protein